jgi:hypothetical protein
MKINIDLEELRINRKLKLPTEKDLKEYMRCLDNDGIGYISNMSRLAIPKLILLVKYYQDKCEELSDMTDRLYSL